ncbi:hypothetical protein A6P39_041100 [Streptomyces sp. FXJ1.172]|uniref:hypothetical protein n=1 Tax=Streptomyces sp. FXJ1.172 TaxID=710705 RepID=UPI0013319764|nr:hypothetical protein [Streptomyces sp. FXJ1.172]WEO99916.1 hypothetical protein A6P39_041100 [Streptomyces sp. FXJ1.172]
MRAANLRLGAALAEVEGLYSALLTAGGSERRRRLQAELARSAGRLAALAALPPETRSLPVAPRRSRRGRRRAMAERGAAWITAKFGRDVR